MVRTPTDTLCRSVPLDTLVKGVPKTLKSASDVQKCVLRFFQKKNLALKKIQSRWGVKNNDFSHLSQKCYQISSELVLLYYNSFQPTDSIYYYLFHIIHIRCFHLENFIALTFKSSILKQQKSLNHLRIKKVCNRPKMKP